MGEQYRLMFWLCDEPQKHPVIRRILHAWTILLGDAAEARRRWARLHGLLVIGEDAEKIRQALGEQNPATQSQPHRSPDPVARSPGDWKQEPPEPPEQKFPEREPPEDVTLL